MIYTTLYSCGHKVISNVEPVSGQKCPLCAQGAQPQAQAQAQAQAERVRQATGLLAASAGERGKVKL